ncbi:MAG: hypothetical protein PHQ28_00135 [Mycobacterium sp.]|nr:hypothetical protein [Mycobacterium sp.]
MTTHELTGVKTFEVRKADELPKRWCHNALNQCVIAAADAAACLCDTLAAPTGSANPEKLP